MDLVPALAAAFFSGKLPATLSPGQAAILLCLGCQQLDISDVDKALDLPTSQVLALFSKVRWEGYRGQASGTRYQMPTFRRFVRPGECWPQAGARHLQCISVSIWQKVVSPTQARQTLRDRQQSTMAQRRE